MRSILEIVEHAELSIAYALPNLTWAEMREFCGFIVDSAEGFEGSDKESHAASLALSLLQWSDAIKELEAPQEVD